MWTGPTEKCNIHKQDLKIAFQESSKSINFNPVYTMLIRTQTSLSKFKKQSEDSLLQV